MKVVYLLKNKNNPDEAVDKTGFFAWENKRWQLYSTEDKKLDNQLQEFKLSYGKTQGKIHELHLKTVTREDKNYLKEIFLILLTDFLPDSYRVSESQTITQKQFYILKETFGWKERL